MEAIEILKREHTLVERVAHAAQRGLAADAAGADCLHAEDLARLLDFFEYFTCSCHDPKEEHLLFPALHRRGLSWEEYPLRDLVREHAELSTIIQSARGWLGGPHHLEPAARGPLLYDLELYVDLLERHIATEEDVLFPLATRRLSPLDLAELGEAFREIACHELESGEQAYFSDLAHELAGSASSC
jgi:hemerythrin-like domain-containing protein